MDEIGDSLDQPIMEKDDLCIFETADGFSLRQFGEGEKMKLPAELSDEFWDELKSKGWKEVLT